MCFNYPKVHNNGTMDDIYIREKPPKLGKSPCRKFGSQNNLVLRSINSFLMCTNFNCSVEFHFPATPSEYCWRKLKFAFQFLSLHQNSFFSICMWFVKLPMYCRVWREFESPYYCKLIAIAIRFMCNYCNIIYSIYCQFECVWNVKYVCTMTVGLAEIVNKYHIFTGFALLLCERAFPFR